jgi:hypothetical protein
MRTYVFAAAIVAAFLVGPISAKAAGGDDCEELKLACEHKDQLGEQGEGNCRKYRETCLKPPAETCADLRKACLHKGELGERGEGNCRKYREQCRR